MGQKPFVPTQKQRNTVAELAGLLVPHEVIGRVLGIDPKTLRKHFRDELDHGHASLVANLKANVYASARAGSLRASFYLLDRMGCWPEPETAAAPEVRVRVIGGFASISDQPPKDGSDPQPS